MSAPSSERPAGKHVQLLSTCLCDAFFDDAARATVEVLEYLGCKVDFPEAQTCCGQPAFNSGDWAASRRVVRHTARVFAGSVPVVVPSASCAAMLIHGAPLEFEKEADHGEIDALGNRAWELGDFIVNGLGVKTWPGKYPAKIAFHTSCHSRGSKSGESSISLLRSIAGVEVVTFGEGEQCCGFGGTFSVTFPNISTKMGDLKLDNVRAAQPDLLVSGDSSCMMHLAGMAEKEGKPIKTLHFVQVLRDALKNGGLLPA